MEAIITLILVLGLSAYAFRTLRKRMKNQSRLMRRIATDNGWTYKEAPDAAMFSDVAAQIGFQADAIKIIFLIEGTAYGKNFELFAIMGSLAKAGPLPNTNVMYGGIKYATLLRTRSQMDVYKVTLGAPANGMTFEGMNYLVYGANVMRENEVNALLGALA